MPQPYQPPTVAALGTVEELTAQQVNKVGSAEDNYTELTNGIVIGSVVPLP